MGVFSTAGLRSTTYTIACTRARRRYSKCKPRVVSRALTRPGPLKEEAVHNCQPPVAVADRSYDRSALTQLL